MVVFGGATLAVCETVLGQAAEVRESDSDAKALDYVTDAARVDRSKHPQFSDPQACVNCQLYAPKAGSDLGTCTALSGKLVRSKGWCSAYQAAM
jgi:hypothetical protein